MRPQTLPAAPPTVLNMEEFRRDWEPRGWRLLVIGPTATWRTEWGEWEAIRDIVQNALNETEAYDWGYGDDGLYTRDEGGGMASCSASAWRHSRTRSGSQR